MKRIKQLLCALAVLCLLLSLPGAALAAEEPAGPEAPEAAEPAGPKVPEAEDAAEAETSVYPELDSLYKDKTWDEVVRTFLEKYNLDPDDPNLVTLGYYNTVTGEEHYLHPDQYMVSGSMYKVPLNMAFAEKVSSGELDWDTTYGTYKLSDLRDATIIHSDNELARTLWTILSNGQGYHRYREIIAPYMGVDPETVEQKYYENNFFTARQMIYCLKLLYDNPDRFPTIVETMQKAEPNRYFKLREKRFDIAHKYGFLVTEYHQNINDCGIAFTDDPILLVIFTDNVAKAYPVITEYATLMCDYTQYHTAQRLAEEAEEARRLAEEQARAEAEAEAARAEAEAQQSGLAALFTPRETEAPAEKEPVTAERRSISFAPFVAAVAVVVATVISLALLIRWRRRYRLRLPWALAATLLCALALLLCTIAVSRGPLLAKPSGEPREAVSAFFDALQAGDYEAAYEHMDGYSSLGLENEPQTASGRLLYQALRQSYGYTLIGDSTVDGMNARQQMQFRYLDVPALEADARTELENVIVELSRDRAYDQVYDADNNYLAAFAQEAYARALETVLSHAADYYATTGVQLSLRSVDGSWRVVPDQNLLKVLSGGLAY